MSARGLGMVAICEDDQLCGVFTDGDLRRAIDQGADVHNVSVDEVMTINPSTIESDALAFDAVNQMQERKITSLPVVSEKRLIGVVTMHQLLQSGVV